MSAAQLLCWSFLFPLPTLLLSAFGLPRRAGALSFLAPLAVLGVAVAWLFTGADAAAVKQQGWIPFLPDTAFHLAVDSLSGVMLLVVGFVATCVYVYSLGYMHDDERQHRFFAFLDFFVACMCLLVVAGNLSVLLIGWTGVGIASFLLISFYWQKDGPLQAGFLALGANAIGDAALLVAAVMVPVGAGALTGLDDVATQVPGGATALGALLVIAACAKSAQGPLWWWLPSAMAGPTPVSALIHAATMVAAGVYLLVRVSPLLEMSTAVSYNVALVGLVTAIGGGIASLWQSNFKRGLAYSTVSQLGWMFAAIGLGAPFAALFHLVTHASFKAMLFLSAGTVIAATHHEEEIANLGGLRKKLPFAHACFALGTLALIGTPIITSGSFSKDAILEGALHSSWPVFGWILLGSVVLTGAYAGRLFFGVFYGPEGSSSHQFHPEGGHAPGAIFNLPLVPLAIGAVVLGYAEAGTHALSTLLAPTVAAGEPVHVAPTGLGLAAFGCGLVGVGLGWAIARTKTRTLPQPPLGLVDAVLGEFRALPEGIAAVHAGRVGRYVLVGVLGTALFVFLAQRVAVEPEGRKRTPSSSSSSSSSASSSGSKSKPKKARPAASDVDEAARRAMAQERLKRLLGPDGAARLRKREGVAQPTPPAATGTTAPAPPATAPSETP